MLESEDLSEKWHQRFKTLQARATGGKAKGGATAKLGILSRGNSEAKGNLGIKGGRRAVDALLDFERPDVGEDEQPRRENRSIVQLDLKEFNK